MFSLTKYLYTLVAINLAVSFFSRIISIKDQHKREANEKIQRMLMLMQHYKIPWKIQEEYECEINIEEDGSCTVLSQNQTTFGFVGLGLKPYFNT